MLWEEKCKHRAVLGRKEAEIKFWQDEGLPGVPWLESVGHLHHTRDLTLWQDSLPQTKFKKSSK